MNQNESDLGAFLAGFVMGALVGAATALILAPQSGRATREQIANLSADIRQAGTEQFENVRSTADQYTHDIRERAQNLGENMQDQMRIVLDAGKEKVDEIVDKLEDDAATA